MPFNALVPLNIILQL